MRHLLLRTWETTAGTVSADAFSVAELERLRLAAVDSDRIERPRFCAQDAALLADGLHYETRIAERGELATRESHPHDFFNALVWLRHPRLKRALNARQVADIARVGPKQRTRGQCALTHFDEAGAIVWLAGTDLLPAWDAHDWSTLFGAQRAGWGRSIAVTVFGHALVEHVWNGHDLPVAKALAVRVDARAFAALDVEAGSMVARWPDAEARVAAAIAAGELLADPQELRPLPLAGIPGWHVDGAQPAFLREAPCFRPLRPGRRYPAPYAP
ncbi:DUF3025 domain-containing protein [Dokdonella ginsengisoli]|uniref:DUF3025 domain-containing protein n=1 Tax=Dokdonella ginsengisoli TaxID=363846 RepID=A0ABV9QV33_9GAMM